jgi:hypothetical protein
VNLPDNVVRAGIKRSNVIRAGMRWVRDHIMLAGFVDSLVTINARRYTHDDLEKHREGAAESFITGLESLRTVCEENGVELIVASQQANSNSFDRSDLDGVTYAQEVAMIEKKMDDQGDLGAKGMYFLTHSWLMERQRGWVQEKGVGFVDIIAALDDSRSVMLSWVHMAPRAATN